MIVEDILYIVMPAYNEEANILNTVKQWYPLLEGKNAKSKLVIADSGSTDSTHKILEDIKREYPKLEVLSGTGKSHGSKVIALYKYAITQGADYIFQTDSDGQTNPDEFQNFWDMRLNYDAILGQRQSRGDGKIREIVQHIVCVLLKLYFGVKVPDANAPFRLMKTTMIEKYLDRFVSDYDLPNIMLTMFFTYYHERVFFLPITFQSRQGGTNFINMSRIMKIGWKALRDFKRFKKDM